MNFLGKLLKVRGNKGEVICTSPETGVRALEEGEIVLLKSEKHQKSCKIERLREIKGNPVLKFEGIDTINDALTLVGYAVYGQENGHSSPMDTEFVELENFTVMDINGDLWGKVVNRETSGLNELLEVLAQDGTRELYYVPLTESIVKEINRDTGIIIIDPPDGLKDVNKK